MRGKKDATTFPDKPVSWIASLFRGLMKEYSCDYRVYTRKIYIIRGKLKNFKVQLLRSNTLFLCRHEDTSSFLSLIDKHFPKDHSLRKIFNRNTIKISYSCMNNTKQVIDNHNKRILHSSHSSYTKDNKDGTGTNKTCNCRQKNNCPLNGNCLQSSVVYFLIISKILSLVLVRTLWLFNISYLKFYDPFVLNCR